VREGFCALMTVRVGQVTMSVRVKRERADQRRHHRVTAPIFVDVGGHRLRAADWSLGGLRIEGFPTTIPEIGAEVLMQMTLPFQGFDVSFDAKGQCVRGDAATGMFAVKFTALGERERELMSHFIEELIRGSMVNVEDTIQRIDVPVTPAALIPDASPTSQLPVRRWPIKTVVMTTIYGVLGILVFGYTGLLGYSNFYRMEVQTAVISAPVDTVASPVDGRVGWTAMKPGDPVKTGDIIVNVLDSQLEREIELADIAIREQKAKLLFAKQRHADELERLKGFAGVEMKNLEQTKLELESLDAQVRAAEQQHGRLKFLHTKGFTTETILENAERQAITLKKTLESKRVELNARIALAGDYIGKRFYTGTNLIGDVGQTEAQLRLAEHEVSVTQQRHSALLNHRNRLAVHAPFDGNILELPRVDQGSIRRGDIIAIVEQRSNRQVTAYLNQDEILKIGLGDEAMVFVPALSETLKGRVTKIDRTSGFINEQDQRRSPGYNWRGPSDRSAKVIISFEDQAKVADPERYRSGLPVVVVFPQRSTNSLLTSIKQKLQLSL
jgi:multidrug resistance efflux pump